MNSNCRNINTLGVVEDESTLQNPENEIMSSFLEIEIQINNDGDLEVVDNTPYDAWYDYRKQMEPDEPEEPIDEEDDEIDPENPDIPDELENTDDENPDEPEEDDEDEPEEDEHFRIRHYVMERVIKLDGKNDPVEVIWCEHPAYTVEDLRHDAVYTLTEDGLYHYQKLIIPTNFHLAYAKGDYVYYDLNDGLVHFGEESEGRDTKNAHDDFDDIFDEVMKEGYLNCFYFSADTFSMYNLIKCYALKEKERLLNYIKNSCGKCSINSNLDGETDILLSAINVIAYLLDLPDYTEAQRILNALDTCGGLCKNYSSNLKGCGCGRS